MRNKNLTNKLKTKKKTEKQNKNNKFYTNFMQRFVAGLKIQNTNYLNYIGIVKNIKNTTY